MSVNYSQAKICGPSHVNNAPEVRETLQEYETSGGEYLFSADSRQQRRNAFAPDLAKTLHPMKKCVTDMGSEGNGVPGAIGKGATQLRALHRYETSLFFPRPKARDLLVLTKPNIVLMCLFMLVAGAQLAPGIVSATTMLLSLLGTSLAVAGANTLNMYLERQNDELMRRTRKRPLPDQRLNPRLALTLGLSMIGSSILVLGVGVNWISAALASAAAISYVWVYTPMKKRTHWALLVGTIPGAVPPLIGWATVTGEVEYPGLVLFAVMVIWQIPHFIAIALYRQEDYRRGGIRVLPIVKGEIRARREALLYTTLLTPVSLLLIPLGYAGPIYGIFVVFAGVYFLGVGLFRLREKHGRRGARAFFVASLFYLPLVGSGLVLGDLLR